MATIRARANGTFELRVVHRSLDKPYYSTHDDRGSAEVYAARLIQALDLGHVPPELRPAPLRDTPVSQVLRHYLNHAPIADSDREMVCFLQERVTIGLADLTVRWVDAWLATMKSEELKPGTIRKRVESLARAVDWWYRREYENSVPPSHPLRTLPKGYSTYRGMESPVTDTTRNRRLAPGEVKKIETVILGMKKEGRQRPLAVNHPEMFLLLFRLILNTGLRLREAYRLKVSSIRPELRTINVAASKTGRARDIPLLPQYRDWISDVQLPTAPEDLLFPFWNGTKAGLKQTTNRLSSQFTRVFEYAGCEDLTEHDLRHEATCRWMLMRDSSGRWMFRPEEVRKITGHLSVQQFERYLSLRGSDLADRLWDAQ